jgi:heme oxygenase
MNICDDVYRNQVEDPELTDKQKNNILESAKIAGRDTEVMEKVESGIINAFNYKASMAKLERLAQ